MKRPLSVRARLVLLCAVLIGLLAANVMFYRAALAQGAARAEHHYRQYQRVQQLHDYQDAVAAYRARAAAVPAAAALSIDDREALTEAQRQLERRLTDLRSDEGRSAGDAAADVDHVGGLLQATLKHPQIGAARESLAALRLALADVQRRADAATAGADAALVDLRRAHAESRQRASLRANAIGGASLLLALALAALIVRSILQPLERTVAAIRAVNAGRIDVPLPPVGRDEFGDLALGLHHYRDHAARLNRLVFHDPLTDLPNRAKLEAHLRTAIEGYHNTGHGLGLLFLDLDNLKTVNESLGHGAGDRYLQAAALRLQGLAPRDAFLCRYSGDEFAIMLANVPTSGAARQYVAALAHDVLRGMAQDVVLDDLTLSMSVSIGVAFYPVDGFKAEELLSSAEAAMYLAKRQGRNNVQFSSRELTEEMRTHLSLASEIRRGVEAGEFEPFFQPMMDASRDEVVALEALLRWRHPTRGLVLPHDFIQIAEESGAIGALSQRCLRRGCEQAVRWRDAGRVLPLAVNLSALQLRESDIIRTVSSVISETGIDPRLLEFEITETAMMESPRASEDLLQALKRLGVSLCIDDFGTGYSSLGYLQRFAIDKIKIDRSFVARLTTSREAEAIVTATLAMARSLNLIVVAEGVETEEQRRRLLEMGCVQQQGFLYTPPLPAVELEAWLNARSKSGA